MGFDREKIVRFHSVAPLTLLSLLCVSTTLAHTALASDTSPESIESKKTDVVDIKSNDLGHLDAITEQILRKELELQRLSTQFRAETTLTSQWRQRRVFLYGETNASCSEAGILTALPVRYALSTQKTPTTNRQRGKLRGSTCTQLSGQLIGMAGDVFELGLNFKHYVAIKGKGFNPAAYRRHVQELHTELDKLITERNGALAHAIDFGPTELKVAQAEGQLLHDMRDLSLIEFSKFHSATRRFWVFQNTAFLVDFAKNSTGATANIIGLVANHLHRPRLNGTGGVFQTISGVIVLLTPVVGRVTGNISGLAAQKVTSKELTHIGAHNAETFSLHRQQFTRLVADNISETGYVLNARRRQGLYAQEETLLLSTRQFLKAQRERASGTMRENIIFAAAVGPPRVANGVLGILGGWEYSNNRNTRDKLLAAGSTGYLAGTSFNLLETTRVEVSAEIQNRELEKAQLLPRQQFAQRLHRLYDMEKILTN